MTHESIASITRERERERERERRNEKKKKVGEKERWRFCFGLAHSFYLFLFFLMKVYLSHLDVASTHGFILHVDYYFLSCFFFRESFADLF